MSKDSGMRAPPRSGGTIRGACGPPRSRYETDSQYEGRSTFWHHSIFILRGAAQRHGSLREGSAYDGEARITGKRIRGGSAYEGKAHTWGRHIREGRDLH